MWSGAKKLAKNGKIIAFLSEEPVSEEVWGYKKLINERNYSLPEVKDRLLRGPFSCGGERGN